MRMLQFLSKGPFGEDLVDSKNNKYDFSFLDKHKDELSKKDQEDYEDKRTKLIEKDFSEVGQGRVIDL